jgi:hypothetical protein
MTLAATTFFLLASAPASADTQVPKAEPSDMWECPQADGSLIYTNKEKAGCKAMALKPLSVVPSLDHMPTIPRTMLAEVPHYQVVPPADRLTERRDRSVPDWARDWHASVAQDGPTQEDMCSLYSEWLNLVQKTRGGFYYGTDPSYGSDLSGRNQRGPSQSFYDNTRYLALSRLFGTGFLPAGCQ